MVKRFVGSWADISVTQDIVSLKVTAQHGCRLLCNVAENETLCWKRKAAIDLHADQLRTGLYVPREYHPQTLISCKLGVLSAGRKAGCVLSLWVVSGFRRDEFKRWALISSSKVRCVTPWKVIRQNAKTHFTQFSCWCFFSVGHYAAVCNVCEMSK